MIIFFTMVPRRKEYSNNLRSLVIKHFQNGHSQREIATKTLIFRETLGISLTSTKEPNALETCSVKAKTGRSQQQLTEQFSVY